MKDLSTGIRDPCGPLNYSGVTRGQVEPITAQLVAEEFDVTPQVALEAMWALIRERGATM